MKGLLKTIVSNIVDQPHEVFVRKIEDSKTITLKLTVADEDMGKVIGKQGKIAKAIRTVIQAAATKEGKKASVKIIQ
ncbi:KH domain-containing protein [Natroniella sulfidigena]|uniref:KH domain-containing protein n=1 Tax=Natroniella sulfidigena TaxID=723921 RepID=UPI00200A01F9|nr:KH domain-containing protein [Natroniella sulfidigena]MCK8816559.1 KH domain-containing protein [Natroniella sulfidigena]